MAINISNFLISKKEKSKMADFQDLDHLDGLSISVTSANLYKHNRDDLVMFYFRNGAEHASAYTKSSIISENISQFTALHDPSTPRAPPAKQKTRVAVVLTGMPKSE